MLITRTSPLTGKTNTHDLDISQEEYAKWENGAMIQDAFPQLNEDAREFILSGLDFGEFRKLFDFRESESEIGARAEESSPKKESLEKVYSPPSSKIYSTNNIAYHKFHKVRPVYKYLNSNIYLAGGSLRTVLKCAAEDVCDFDLFFKSLGEVQPLRDKLEADGFEQTYECPDGFLYSYKRGKHKIQLICEVEYATPYVLLNSFDIAACIFCWHDGIFYYGREAVRSVFTKKLRVNNVSFPVATLKRLVKYANKGYNICSAAEDFCRQVSGKTFGDSDFRQYID